MKHIKHTTILRITSLVYSMGQFSSTESSSDTDSGTKQVAWNKEKFAEGRFRYAIMGTWNTPVSKSGEKCIIKHLKDSYTWKPTEWNTTMRMHRETKQLAESFNKFHSTGGVVRFADVNVFHCVYHPNNEIGGPKLNEYHIVETYISGKYTKWCNNYGYWNNTEEHVAMMQAFSHWSWYQTRGQRMIADLQGATNNGEYILTDPAILSLNGREYGATDTGVEGMAIMLLKHTCNLICEHLPKPTVADLYTCIPLSELQDCIKLLYTVNDSTAYNWEQKLSVSTRNKLVDKLKNIAISKKLK